jgi:hypothetical protein
MYQGVITAQAKDMVAIVQVRRTPYNLLNAREVERVTSATLSKGTPFSFFLFSKTHTNKTIYKNKMQEIKTNYYSLKRL